MRIEAGYDIAFTCPQEVSIVLMLSVHPSRQKDLLTEHRISFSSGVLARDYLDAFGNVCTRLVAPPGILEIAIALKYSTVGCPMRSCPAPCNTMFGTCRTTRSSI
jgi:hypothetical protein